MQEDIERGGGGGGLRRAALLSLKQLKDNGIQTGWNLRFRCLPSVQPLMDSKWATN